jgi:uncharacterized protein (TIGR04562 family)
MFQVETSNRLDLPWETLEGMIKGISAIDIHQMSIQNLEEAEQFILNYGYDLSHPNDKEELHAIFKEAVDFIQCQFLNPDMPWEDMGAGSETLKVQIPQTLLEESDIRKLLLHASIGNGIEQRWACAILKVMHTISHINNTLLYHYFEKAKNQILSRYKKALSQTTEGEWLIGNPNETCLSIAGFETKDEKSRDSMILKLLCKRENVAEEVFDMIGIRIITHSGPEAILALEILRQNRVIIFPNIIPSRSRNSLIDFDEFKIQYQEALETYQWGQSSLKQTLQMIQHITPNPSNGTFNPENASSLLSYRAIHMTERQLIRFQETESDKETRFFFPYEIQIVDEANHLQNMKGSSAHVLYKQSQLIQARNRVLGPLFITLRGKARSLNKDSDGLPSSIV